MMPISSAAIVLMLATHPWGWRPDDPASNAQADVQAEQAETDRGVAECKRRFKSYDPTSRSFLGYDGRRHRCPG
jgi:hypothetical protein